MPPIQLDSTPPVAPQLEGFSRKLMKAFGQEEIATNLAGTISGGGRKGRRRIGSDQPPRDNNSMDLICVTNARGQFVHVNAASERVLGYKPEELIGKLLLEFVYREDRERTSERLEDRRRGVENSLGDNRYVRKDGSLAHIMWSSVWSEEDGMLYAVGRDMTRLKEVLEVEARATKELERSEARFRSVVQNTPELITLLDADGTVVYQSPSVEWILGYPFEEFVGRTGVDLIHAEDVAHVSAAFEKLLSEGGTVTDTFRIRAKSGDWRWMASIMTNCLNDPALNAIMTVSRDVTEKYYEETLLTTTSRVAEILTTGGDFEDAVQTALELIGEALRADRVFMFRKRTAADVQVISQMVEWCRDGVDPQIANPSLQNLPMASLGAWNSLIEAGKTVASPTEEAPPQIRILLAEQQIRSTIFAPVTVDGALWGLLGMDNCSDNHGWKETEKAALKIIANIMGGLLKRNGDAEEIRRNEERLRLALESARMGIWEWNATTDRLTGSPQMYELLGTNEADLGGNKEFFYRMLPGDDLAELLREGEKAFTDGTTLNVEYPITRPDGEERWMQSRGQVTFADGKPSRMMGTITDVTDRKLAERSIIEAKDRAEQLVLLRDSFLANMSHEIRTPLTGILGFSEILSDLVPEEGREFLDIIQINGKRLLDTIDSVLNLAQLESKTLHVAPNRFDAVRELELAVRGFDSYAHGANLTLSLDTPSAPVHLLSDQAAFGRIIGNLVSNGLKFTREGGVNVALLAGEEWISVRVEDTGIGIDPHFLPNLFDDFRQESEGLSRRFEGSGLGLAITKRLADLIGAEIDVESNVGGGTIFTIRFPAVAAPDETVSLDFRNSIGPSPKPSILVVEDDVQTQKLMALFLERSYLVDMATSYEAALQSARKNRYDLFLIDINLGRRETGIDLLKSLREIPVYSEAPMVACTAYSLPGDDEQLIKEGFDSYIGKPFRREELLTRLEQAVIGNGDLVFSC